MIFSRRIFNAKIPNLLIIHSIKKHKYIYSIIYKNTSVEIANNDNLGA